MTCCIPGCEKRSRNQSGGVCEMHYYRKRRTGSYDDPVFSHRAITSHGYVSVVAWGHPLASKKSGRVYEHRKVLFDAMNCERMRCEMCGKALTWRTCHVDHVNDDKQDNRLDNLRPLCPKCNTHRSGRAVDATKGRAITLTVLGETRSANDWASMPFVRVSKSTILRRKKSGMSDYDVLFAPKITHRY